MGKETIVDEETVKELDKLSQFANKGGRPKTWTAEAIETMAVELIDWAQLKTSLILSAFATSRRCNPQILSVLAATNPRFAEALLTAKRLIGERRETGTLLKKFEPKTYSMSQRMYDPDLNKHLDNQLEKDELIKARAKVKALEEQLKLQNEQSDEKQIIINRYVLS